MFQISFDIRKTKRSHLFIYAIYEILDSTRLRLLHTKNVLPCANVSCMLTYQRALRAYVSTCFHAYVLNVSTWLASSLPHMSTCIESLVSHGLFDHVITSQNAFAFSVSSFDATFFRFTVVVVEVVHTVGEV